MKVSIAIAWKAKKLRHLFQSDEAFFEYRDRMQKDLQRYMHGCHIGDMVYGSNWVEETVETAKQHQCPIGKLKKWGLSMTGPIFWLEGQDDYFWVVLPAKQ